ncbi:hypothetical protein Tco_1037818 [Tanacetum coccineum]
MYASPPSITIVRPWFTTIGYSGEIREKGTLKKSFLPPRWRLLMGQIIQCLGGKIGGLDQISNKDATILYCLANGVQVDYDKLIWDDLIHKLNKKTREKIVPYPRFISILLEHMMHKYDNEELTINPTQFPQDKKPGAKSQFRRKQSSKHTSESKTEASKSKSGQSKKDTQSNSAKDKSPSHISPPIPVVGEMHKEAQQAAGGPTSLGGTSKEGAHPQLSSGSNPSVFVDKTKSVGDGLKTSYTKSGSNEESRADDLSKKIKLEDLSEFLKDTRSAFFTPDSPQDEPIIVIDESEEEKAEKEDTHDTSHDVPEDTSVPPPPSPKSAQNQELMAQVQLLQSPKDELEQQKAKAKAEIASLKARPYYPDINQIPDLLVTSLKPELSKLLASHNFASCLPTDMKELPLKFNKLSGEIKELKQHVKDMEIELPGDLKKIPTKLETFTSTICGLTSQDVPSAGEATALPTEGEKNIKDTDTNLIDELVDLLVKNVVTQYYTKSYSLINLMDKMLKRKENA